MIAPGENPFEEVARLLRAADRRQRVDVPEAADREGGRRRAEIVGRDVAKEIAVAFERAPDRRDRRDEPIVGGGDDAQFVQQQHAGVDILAVEAAREAFQPGVPGSREDALAQIVGRSAPLIGAFVESETRRDPRKPVAGDPAHGGRIGMDRGTIAIFPNPGVGRERDAERAHSQRLERGEQSLAALLGQALVEEHLRGRQNDAAVDVVLRLILWRRCRRAPDRSRDNP